MKSNYWSCSKFADWLRGTPKLSSGTSEEWRLWERLAKEKSFRYWLAENGLDYLQDILCWPANRVKALRSYVNNRWFIKSHSLTSRLERGQWYDLDTRLLHAPFDELVNFVEVEAAWMHVICSSEEYKKYNIPWYRRLFRIGLWRCPEAGIAHLEWASELKNDEDWRDKESLDFGLPTRQALAAQEIFLLYKWWKNERPKRPDPYEVSGWRDYCKEKLDKAKENDEENIFDALDANDKSEVGRKILDLCHKIENEQEEEDTVMLIRLIKIRHHLWT